MGVREESLFGLFGREESENLLDPLGVFVWISGRENVRGRRCKVCACACVCVRV